MGLANGQFTLKSAYVGAKEMLEGQSGNASTTGQRSGTSGDEGKWKRIWRIKAPMKVKHFMWRSIPNILPVNNAIFQRKTPMDPMCPLFGMCPESVNHMLFNCNRATKVWLVSPFRFRPEVMVRTQLDEIWSSMGNLSKGQDLGRMLGLFASLCWQIRKSRTERVFP